MVGEVFVQCHTGPIDATDMASKHPITQLIINLPVCTHSMALSLAQAVVVSHGVEAAAEFLVVGEGSVVGNIKK